MNHDLLYIMIYYLLWSSICYDLLSTMIYYMLWSTIYYDLLYVMIYYVLWSTIYHDLLSTMIYYLLWSAIYLRQQIYNCFYFSKVYNLVLSALSLVNYQLEVIIDVECMMNQGNLYLFLWWGFGLINWFLYDYLRETYFIVWSKI